MLVNKNKFQLIFTRIINIVTRDLACLSIIIAEENKKAAGE